MPERGHGAEGTEHERRGRAPVDRRRNVACELSRFTNGMLSQCRVGTAVWPWNRRTVAKRPHLWMAAASHRAVDRDPASLIADDRDGARDGARDDARRQDDGARVDRVVLKQHTFGLDRSNGG